MPRMSYSRRTVGSKRCAVIRTGSPSGVLAKSFLHGSAQIVTSQGKGNIGFQKAFLASAVKSCAGETQPVEGNFVDRPCHGIGQLDLSAGPLLLRSEERRVGKECRAR